MKKSMDLYCNSTLSTQEKLMAFKNAGYEEFFTGVAYLKNETLNLKQQVAFGKSIGLNCTMIHCEFYEPHLDYFWQDHKLGNVVLKNYAKQIKKYHKLCPNFVVHLDGSHNAQHTTIGLNRLLKLLKICKKLNVNLCIENCYTITLMDYIFSNITHENLKLCYDCGHNHCYSIQPVSEQLAKRIWVTHIHDNNGKDDEHKPLEENSEIFNSLKNVLKSVNPTIVLSSEIKFLTNDNLIPVINSNLNVLNNLEK